MLKNVLTLYVGLFGLAISSIHSLEAAQSESEMPKKVVEGANHAYFALPKEIQLTTDQKTALDEIKQKQASKVNQLSTQLSNLLTKEQKAARQAAIAKAKMDGVKGKDRKAAIDQAVNLTDDQKKLLKEVKPELAKLRLEIKQQIYSLLTEEQRTHYKLPKSTKSAATRETKMNLPNS